MKYLEYELSKTLVPSLYNQDYEIRPHDEQKSWSCVNKVTMRASIFSNLDYAFSEAFRAGFVVRDSRELAKFINECKRLSEYKNYNFGNFELMDNPIILQAINKYGNDSKQVQALIKLYKD